MVRPTRASARADIVEHLELTCRQAGMITKGPRRRLCYTRAPYSGT